MEHYTENNGLVQLHFVPSFFLKIPDGETLDSVQLFAFVLDCISMFFQIFIPDTGKEPLVIINEPNRECPTCYKTARLIALNTAPSRLAQISYQFAHELCHYCISGTVDPHLRWFEESVCETASLFFLQKLGYIWQRKNVKIFDPAGKPYADELIRYAADTARDFVAFDLKDSATRKQMEADRYDRKRNRYMANHLLAVFSHHPGTWSAIPLLGTIHQQSLEEALDAWILASPAAAQPGLREIRALF